MNRYLIPLLVLVLPLLPASATPTPDLEVGIQLVRSGTSRNLKRGAKLVHMAAMGGEPRAEYVMGWLYLKGKGTKRSPKRAVQWFRKAADKGNRKAQLALGRLLGRSQSAKLRKEAWRWLEAAHAQGAPEAKVLLAALADGRIGDSMMKKTEKAASPAGSGSSRPRASATEATAEVTVINMGRGTPATPAEEAALRQAEEQRAQEAAARRKRWAEQASAQNARAAEAQKSQAEAAKKAAEARRQEAVDRAARRAAGLPELPRGQVSPHLRKKK